MVCLICLFVDPRVMTRRSIEEEIAPAAGSSAGARRRAVALQLEVHRLWVEEALRELKRGSMDELLTRRELQQLMTELDDDEDGETPDGEVEFVLTIAEHHASDQHVAAADVIMPLAMWRGLQKEMDFLMENFSAYDADGSGRIERPQLKALLTDLNGHKPPSDDELEWILSLGVGGRDQGQSQEPGVNRLELRVGVTIWMHHVAHLDIQARRGCEMLVPFVYTLIASVASCVVVAATTILFSEAKTIEWLASVGMGLVWRNFLIDPLKAIAFGRWFEFIFGLIFGGCALQDAAAGVLQDEIEGSGEALADGAGDMLNDLASGEGGGAAEAVAADVDLGGGDLSVGGDLLPVGASAGDEEEAIEDAVREIEVAGTAMP